jgi:hypothetical protein
VNLERGIENGCDGGIGAALRADGSFQSLNLLLAMKK